MESKFPINFDHCPYCGSKETLSGIATEELVEEGKLPKGTAASSRKKLIPLIPPQTAKLTLPILLLHYGICAGCGHEICTRAERQDAPVKVVLQQPGFGGQQSFGSPPEGPYPRM